MCERGLYLESQFTFILHLFKVVDYYKLMRNLRVIAHRSNLKTAGGGVSDVCLLFFSRYGKPRQNLMGIIGLSHGLVVCRQNDEVVLLNCNSSTTSFSRALRGC